ncbi:MAG: TolC family protein [Candidatus Omnitrophica bacterium]|nr:TolC family protein [Candidatus Omnitrophota bacterium]
MKKKKSITGKTNKINYQSVLLFILAIGIFCFVFAVPSNAKEKKISLSDAINIALQNNNEILAFKDSLSAQKKNIGIARSYFFPNITFGETYMGTNNPVYVFMEKLNEQEFSASDFNINQLNHPGFRNDFQTALSFDVPIFARGINIRLAMAKKEFSTKQKEYTRIKETITYNVIKAYLMVYTAKEYVGVAEKTLQDSEEHLKVAEARYKSGLGLYSDVLRASTAVTEAKEGIINATTNVKIAERALGLLLGMSNSVDITNQYPEIYLKNISYYTNEALSRSDIEALKLKYENAKNNIRLIKSAYFPTVGLNGSYQMNDNSSPLGSEGNSWMLIVGLQWNWFSGTRRRQETQKAIYEVKEVKNYLSGFKKEAEYNVYKSYLNVNDAKEAIILAQSALKTAKEGERLVSISYANGISPIVDLLDTQVNLDNARANLVAKKNAYRLAIVKLSYESGTILDDFYK